MVYDAVQFINDTVIFLEKKKIIMKLIFCDSTSVAVMYVVSF